MKTICDWHNCNKIGEYKAPVEKDNSKKYRLLCLEHIKEFNKSWNYFENMNDTEILEFIKADMTWHKPTQNFSAQDNFFKILWNNALNENLDKNFVKDLSSKLFDWTGERWIISFSQLKGDISMTEKEQKIKKSLMDEAKNSKIYKDVIKNFSDAELTDINLKGEDEPND